VNSGNYKVDVSSRGFRTFTENVTVSSGETVSLEIPLRLGSSGGVMVFDTSEGSVQTLRKTGSIELEVLDAAGKVIPNAAVTLVNMQTNSRVEQKIGEDGIAIFADVQPGNYQLEVIAPGFTTLRESNLTVYAGKLLGLEAHLFLGSDPLIGEFQSVEIPTTDPDLSQYSITPRHSPSLSWRQKLAHKLHL
jgi:hypothetical protein